MIDTATLIEILETGGLVAALALAVIALVRGWVWPKKMVDKTIKAQQDTAKMMASELADRMEDGIEKGIESGIVKGYLKIGKPDEGSRA